LRAAWPHPNTYGYSQGHTKTATNSPPSPNAIEECEMWLVIREPNEYTGFIINSSFVIRVSSFYQTLVFIRGEKQSKERII
jgi:hypothetical protein